VKIRQGFISNSSSSSFIVAFKENPKSMPELQEMLFGNEAYYRDPWHGAEYPTSSVASRVWESLKSQEPMVVDKMNELLTGYIIGPYAENFPEPKYEAKWGEPDYEKKLEEYYNLMDERAKKISEDFKLKNPNAVFYEFEYEDHNGALESAMEQGDLFRKLPHIKISNH